jgi:ParB family chromosome partitioning protein
MSAKKFDRQAALSKTLGQERKAVQDRFAAAEAISAARPAGLANPAVVDTFSAESDSTLPVLGGGKSATVALHLVHDNPYNARSIYQEGLIQDLVGSLKAQGQLVPALAVEHPTMPGHYQLIDGHYRKKALLHAGIDKIDITLVQSGGASHLYQLSYVANEKRSAQSTLDNAYAWKKLLEDGVVKEHQDIAVLTGTTAPEVSKTLRLLELPTVALEKMRTAPERFGISNSYEVTLLAKYLSEPELLEVMDRVIEEDISTRALAKLRTSAQEGKGRKPKELPRAYKIARAGTAIGALKEWDSGKVVLEVNLLDPKERAHLLTTLKEHFGLQE